MQSGYPTEGSGSTGDPLLEHTGKDCKDVLVVPGTVVAHWGGSSKGQSSRNLRPQIVGTVQLPLLGGGSGI